MLPLLARVDDQTPLRGRTIQSVSASGKHLIIEFSGGLFLRTHLRMNGSWHHYRSGERWRLARDAMRLVIATNDFEAVGFNIPVAEFRSSAEVQGVLLDQRVLAGVGNIYKSEVLYACAVNPFTHIDALTDQDLRRDIKEARHAPAEHKRTPAVPGV